MQSMCHPVLKSQVLVLTYIMKLLSISSMNEEISKYIVGNER